MRYRLLILLLFLTQLLFAAPGIVVKGVVRDAATDQTISGAVIKVDDGAMWAVTDLDGKYTISLPNGKYLFTAECLGYVSKSISVVVKNSAVEAFDASGAKTVPDFSLSVESLALDEVVVTAQRPAGTMGTAHHLGKEALEHMQMSNMTDMAALLPGGKTVNQDLTKDNSFSLRSGGSKAGNAAFGTAVEIDGVRIGNNASMGELSGVSTRSISVENIESIEVMTGVPSAEFGDLGAGMVRVNTKKGRTPVNISFSVNPRTYQTSVSKGFDLQKNRGILNVSGEWARATSKITSPYTSYTRRNVSATYSNTFAKVLRFELGGNVNIGGMDSKDDPDANAGNFEKGRDNAYRMHTNLNWMLNKPWVTSLRFEGSVSFADQLSQLHKYYSSASSQPAVHNEEMGYAWATPLPLSYHSDQMVDSKQLDGALSFKYDWTRSFGAVKNHIKAGVQYKANGNVGQGEYYLNPALSPNGYRPRPYSQYPFMHNLSEYIDEQLTLPIGNTTLDLMAGLRFEQVFIRGTKYKHMNSLSPRFNAKWNFGKAVTLRGGWGVSEKLPSFWVLYPKQEYRDIQTFAFTSGSDSHYAYFTVPYSMEYNEELKWQRNYNSELGIDVKLGEWNFSLVGFYNITKDPYQYTNVYIPVSYNKAALAPGYVLPENPQFKIDSQNGTVYLRGSADEYWEPMVTKVTDRTFVKNTRQVNGRPVYRAGAELIVDFPKIKAIRTSFRLDASYNYSSYVDETLSYYYKDGWSHSDKTLHDRSYEYVGIYARGNSTSTINGKITHNLDMNITSITHIPEARLVFTCRFEAALLRRSQNLSMYKGAEYAYRVSEDGYDRREGSIYDGNSYALIRPVQYMDLDGNVYDFTDAQAADPAFANLLIKTGNAYTFNPDGYGFYCSANFSVTKEIGKHVSISMFANNFTATRYSVKSMATGVSAVFTPAFYYGLTCRLKF